MHIREKIAESGGLLSAGASVLGSYQLCHSLCLSAIALLSVIGITVTGMPLLFLTKVAVPFWTAGVVLLSAMLLFWKLGKMHFSPKLLLANSGLLFAGTPFSAVAGFQKFFWVVGGLILIASIVWAFAGRQSKSCCATAVQTPVQISAPQVEQPHKKKSSARKVK